MKSYEKEQLRIIKAVVKELQAIAIDQWKKGFVAKSPGMQMRQAVDTIRYCEREFVKERKKARKKVKK
jgi:hypothetical protein